MSENTEEGAPNPGLVQQYMDQLAEQLDAMRIEVRDGRAENEVVQIDGYRFVGCEFVGCTLVYRFPTFELIGCRLTDTDIVPIRKHKAG